MVVDWKSAKDNPPKEDGRYFVEEQLEEGNWRGLSAGFCKFHNGKWDSPYVIHWDHLAKPPQETT